MKRTMILPALIALGLHVLLLGFRSPQPEAKPPAKTVAPDPIQIQIPPDDPEIVETADAADDATPTPRILPQIENIPLVRPTSADVITIERPLTPPIKGESTSIIAADWQPGAGTSKFGNIVDAIHLENRPMVRYQPAPVPPRGLHADRVSVVVEFIVGRDGRVLEARIIETSDRAFDEACLAAVRRWKFEPGKKGGVPVAFRVAQPFVFSFRE